jgi:hypothetical protein
MQSRAQAFFELLNESDLGAHVAAYPLDLLFKSPNEAVLVSLRDGRLTEVTEAAESAAVGYWTLELQGDRDIFDAIFAGAWTMGEAMYRGRLFAPEEKAKHNLVSALGQTIRLLQKEHRRKLLPH